MLGGSRHWPLVDTLSSMATPTNDASASKGDTPDSGSSAAKASRLHLWEIQGVRDVLVIVAMCALVYVGYWMRSVTVPLLIALALAYLFEPVVQRLCKFRGITRHGAVLIILLTVGVGVTFLVTFTVPIAIGQTVNLINRVRDADLSKIAERVIEYAPEQSRDELREGVRWIERQFSEAPLTGVEAQPSGSAFALDSEMKSAADGVVREEEKPIVAMDDSLSAAQDERVRELVRLELASQGIVSLPQISRAPGGAPWRIVGAIGSSAEYVSGFLVGLLQLSLIAFLVPFYFYFFSLSFPRVIEFGRMLIPERNRPRALDLIVAMDRAVSGFVRGRIVIAFIMGVMFSLGWLLCGVKYAVPLGLFVGALSLVPYLGGIGVPLAVGLLLFDQLQLHDSQRMAWWAIILWPTLVFVAVQSIEGWVLTPIIAGKATDLDPVTIVVAILAGGSVAGVYGMLLAIPAAACGKILLKEVLLPRIHAWSRGDARDPLPLMSSDS